MANKIYLIPAPDMDERMVAAVQIPNFDIVVVQLPSLSRSTQINDYLKEIETQIPEKNSTLLGFCYGGVLALELAPLVSAKKVIVVSSIKSKDELAFSRKILAKSYFYFPTAIVKFLGLTLTFLIRRLISADIKIPRIWLKSTQNKFIVKHALSWQGVKTTASVIHIHGEKDFVLPVHKIKDAHVIPGGGHFMFKQKRKEVLEKIYSLAL